MSETYELMYWDARGRAETIRVILHMAGKKFKDTRIPMEGDTWTNLKSQMPFGQIPILRIKRADKEDKGEELAQTLAIAQYLARKYGYAGKNIMEQAKIEGVTHKIEEVGNSIIALFVVEQDEEVKKKLVDRLLEPEGNLHETLKYLERFIATNNSKFGFFVGETVTLADIHFYCVCERFLPMMPDCLDKYPHLKAHLEKVKAHPKVAQWLQTRPKTQL